MIALLRNGVRRFLDKPVELNNQTPFADAVLHGPTWQGENVIRDSILGRGTRLPVFPLVPDVFRFNIAAVASGDTLEMLLAPSGGVWLCRVQLVDGLTGAGGISIGDLDVNFGYVTPGTHIGPLRGPTPLVFDPTDGVLSLDLLPGGFFFKGETRIGYRAEQAAGNNEGVFLFSFATRQGQVSPTRLAVI